MEKHRADLEPEAIAEDEDELEPTRSEWNSVVSCFVDLEADIAIE